MIARALGAGLALAVLGLGLQTWRLDAERLAHAQTRMEHTANLAAAQRAALAAQAAARSEEHRRLAALQEVIHDTEQNLARARADAAAAVDVGVRLREHIAGLAARCRGGAGHPAAAGAGAPADATADLLALVQRRLDEAADGLARHADEARYSGRACERAYDALTR